MVTAEALCRVLRIRTLGKNGSAFTIERNGVQYLLTAKHMFENSSYAIFQTFELLLDEGYRKFSGEVRYHKQNSVDIAAIKLVPNTIVTPTYENPLGTASIVFGQDVYFLGFPLDYDEILIHLPERQIPAPFIKRACLSSMFKDKEGINWLLLDGHNNLGFSGGLVCAHTGVSRTMALIGIICSYRFEKRCVFDATGNETAFFVKENSGIINACDIIHALEIIDSGFKK
jgi:hypothetical protein